jgi:hypothetical protein
LSAIQGTTLSIAGVLKKSNVFKAGVLNIHAIKTSSFAKFSQKQHDYNYAPLMSEGYEYDVYAKWRGVFSSWQI